jgi:subtilisin family serine protease
MRLSRRPVSRRGYPQALEPRQLLAADLPAAGVTSYLAELAARPEVALVATSNSEQLVPAVADQWIVRFADWQGPRAEQLTGASQAVAAADPNLRVLKHLGQDGTFLLVAPAGTSAASLQTTLARVAPVQYVEPNLVLLNLAIPNDPSFGSQFALNNTGQNGGVVDADIDAPEAWNVTTGSSGVVVGVVDSGVNYTHPDLAANMWHNPGEIPGDGLDNDLNGYVDDIYGWDFANNDSDPRDDEGHGTSVAGIMAAVGNNGIGVAGINWGAKIMALKYARSTFVASTADVTEAVNYATMMRTQYGVNVRALNNSYGVFGYSQALSDAIEASGEAGIMFVASAGNSSSDNDLGPQYPANFQLENVLSIAATNFRDELASFSSFGATTVHLGAAGVGVWTTSMGGGYTTFGGTSAASPMVAGVVALLWDAYPFASLSEIRTALLEGTDPIAALQGITITGGRLNAANSLALLGLQVVAATPAPGGIVQSAPTQFTLRLSHAIDPDSVQAADLLVNGLAAQGFEIIAPDTIRFTFGVSPVTAEGLQTMQLAAGALVRDSDGEQVRAFLQNFRYDAAPLSVVSVEPAAGLAPLPLTRLRFTFSDVVGGDSIGMPDLGLAFGTVIEAQQIDPWTIEYTLAGITAETANFQYFLPAGALTDAYGNPALGYQGSLQLDYSVVPLSTFAAMAPLGSGISASLDNRGNLPNDLDIDDWTVTLAAGETLTVRAMAADPSASLIIEYIGFDGALHTAAPGQPAELPLRRAGSDTTIAIRVRGDRATDYRLDVYRNVGLEGGDPVQPLEPTRIELGSGRYAVLGTTRSQNIEFDLSTDPGWTYTGGWAYGQPLGQGGDPNSGFTGPNVVGYNLSGAYPNNIATTQWVTTGAIDLTGRENSQLSFRRWLGVEHWNYDHAYLEVSNNGTTWTRIWESSFDLIETSWSLQSYDISEVADNQATVFIRWGIGPTDSSVTYAGWNIDDVVIESDAILGVDAEDRYTIDLSDKQGQVIDVILAGQNSVSYADQILELLDPNGQVVATGVPNAIASGQGTGDSAILDFLVGAPGVYTVRISSTISGQYGLLVTESLAFEWESNDTAGSPRDLTAAQTALGHLGTPPVEGEYQFTIDGTQSFIQLDAQVLAPDGAFLGTIAPQTAGSMDAVAIGGLRAQLGEDSIRFRGATLDLLANAGSFQPFNGSADFAGQATILGLSAFAAIRNVNFTITSPQLAWNEAGEFDPTGVFFEFTAGGIDFSALGFSDSLPVNTPDVLNSPGTPATVEVLPGQLRVTIPLAVRFRASVPLGILVDFSFSGLIVANAPLPMRDDDVYSLELQAGDQILLTTSTPLDGAGLLPANTLDPQLLLFHPDGTPAASDQSSAPDGKNAQIVFTATQSGLHQIVVRTERGLGLYVLQAAPAQQPPTATLAGPAAAVPGQPRTFTLEIDDEPADQAAGFEVEVDWNGDGAVDETLTQYTGNELTHAFTELGQFTIGVRVRDSQGATSALVTHSIEVREVLVEADPVTPGLNNLYWGGTGGTDAVYFLASVTAPTDVTIITAVRDSALVNRAQFIRGVNGRVIGYGLAGDDVLVAEFLNRSVEFYGGENDDILVGSRYSDLLLGEAGDDLLYGGSLSVDARDTLVGGLGNDVLIGHRGNDLLNGGVGEDLLLGGLLLFNDVPQAVFAIHAEWKSDRPWSERIANLSGTGIGPRSNQDIFLVPGQTVFDDAIADEMLGGEDADWFLYRDGDDSTTDAGPEDAGTEL